MQKGDEKGEERSKDVYGYGYGYGYGVQIKKHDRGMK